MKKSYLVIAAMAVFLAIPNTMQAQSLRDLYNSAKKAIIKGNRQRQDNTQQTATQQQEPTAQQPVEGARNNVSGMPLEQIAAQFGTFTKTAATKTYMVDNLESLKLGYFFEGRAFVQDGTRGAFCLDENGNKLKTWTPDEAIELFRMSYVPTHFNSGRVAIRDAQNNEAVIYDRNFQVVERLKDVEMITNFCDGVALCVQASNNRLANPFSTISYIDPDGNKIMQNLSSQLNTMGSGKQAANAIRPLRDGLAAFCISDDDSATDVKWGFRDAQGRVVIPAQFAEVQDFSNGLAAVCSGDYGNNKWGFIDTTGNMVIAQQFTVEPSPFDVCGLALVVDKQHRCTFVDRQGNINSNRWDRITPFCGGIALWRDPNESSITYILDSHFNKIATYGPQLTLGMEESTSGGMRIFLNDGKEYTYADTYARVGKGVIMRNGSIYAKLPDYRKHNDTKEMLYGLLSPKGDLVMCGLAGCFESGLVPVYNNRSKEVGYVNQQGQWVVKFEENAF